MVRHYTLTLTGSAQRLSTLVRDGVAGGAYDEPCCTMTAQPGAANLNPVYIGGPGVTSGDYGIRLEAADAGIPPAPLSLGENERGVMRLSDYYALGTVGETVHFLAVI